MMTVNFVRRELAVKENQLLQANQFSLWKFDLSSYLFFIFVGMKIFFFLSLGFLSFPMVRN